MPALTGRRALVGAIIAAVVALAVVLLWPRREGVVEFGAGDIAVIEPWARATPGTSRVGAAYLTIANRGSAPDRLVRAESDVAERIELHNTITKDGVMQMRPIESVALAAGQTVQFAPNGMHFMLMGLSGPLEAGKAFTLRLTFERAGTFPVTVRIAAIGAQAPGGEAHDMNQGGH